MREAVASYLAYEAEEDRTPRRALADAEVGRTISAEAMFIAWCILNGSVEQHAHVSLDCQVE